MRINRLIKKKRWYDSDRNDDDSVYEMFEGQTYTFGQNHIDFISYKADCAAGEIILTEQEIVLLKIFIANKGKPLSREMLLNSGWGYSKETTTRTVDNFIVRFRKYFETQPKKPIYFISRRSVGYIFDHE